MNRKVIVKIFLDIVMLFLYALLMFAKGLGGFFHEVVGLGIGILFIIHVLLNIPMIKGLFKTVKNGKPEKVILLVSDCIYKMSLINFSYYIKLTQSCGNTVCIIKI